VGGAIANKYLNGGAVWTRLNWALGIRKLGFDVYFLEQIDPRLCRDRNDRQAGFKHSVQLAYFSQVMDDFGLTGRSALICGDGSAIHGLSAVELGELAGEASLLINITGHIDRPEFMASPACKVYVDLDPGFTQLWHEQGLLNSNLLQHDHFFSVGEAIGTSDCPIPTAGISWKATRQPVVLEYWPVSDKGDSDRFTTVSAWRDDYGALKFRDEWMGLKVHEFRRFIDLPDRVPQSCELALKIHPEDCKDRERLERHRWVIRDPEKVVPGPLEFREYVQNSGAEFSVAKGIYTQLRSGWFSDRTVRYLASGKPALVQDTGFSANYPVGEGLLAFQTLDEAVTGALELASNYRHHCRAAREIAERYFESDRVLGRLVDEAGVAP
jgi:hypothetical protein